MTMAIVGGALFQWPIGQLTNYPDRGHVFSVVALPAALLSAGLLLAADYGLGAVLVVTLLYGGFVPSPSIRWPSPA